MYLFYFIEFFVVIFYFLFFFNDTATTEIYTLSLHDALPIGPWGASDLWKRCRPAHRPVGRSEEHTSELQSRENLVCRLLLEKKKKKSCYQVGLHKQSRSASDIGQNVVI